MSFRRSTTKVFDKYYVKDIKPIMLALAPEFPDCMNVPGWADGREEG